MVSHPLRIVVHGGALTKPSWDDGTRAAAQAGMDALRAGGSPLDAAVAACAWLEEDDRFNAGLGADLRLDGRTIQMDASCIDSEGRFGAVVGIERTLHPVKVARALVDAPDAILFGEGATAYARRIGHPEADVWSERAQRKSDALRRKVAQADYGPKDCEWSRDALASSWNYAEAFPGAVREAARAGQSLDGGGGAGEHVDTVGAVATDGRTFAAAASTGGTIGCLRGRVGDTPLPGCGIDAGPAGAVAMTGQGNRILRARVAARVLRAMEDGMDAQAAYELGLSLVPEPFPLGLVVLDARGGHAAGARSGMAWSALTAPAPRAQAKMSSRE